MRDKKFGKLIRQLREEKLKKDPAFTLRKFANMIEVSPTYLSKIERDELPPPAEERIILMAKALNADPDELLALAGKVGSDLTKVILRRPKVTADLLRMINTMKDTEIQKVMRKIEDCEW
jgi:transcriptional regulator with XRE-family HTH domain